MSKQFPIVHSISDQMSLVRLTLDLCPPLSIITFCRPAERNKLSIETLDELHRALACIEARADVHVVIFTGANNVFASGADINELRALAPAEARRFSRRGQHLFQRIADSPRLSIAAITGYCFGGGLDLALACHLRFASHHAVFAHPGATLGIITGWGGTRRLPALIGAMRSFELFLTARRLSATEALAFGLIHRVCDVPLVEAIAEGERRAALQ